jgi:hypothetical protein
MPIPKPTNTDAPRITQGRKEGEEPNPIRILPRSFASCPVSPRGFLGMRDEPALKADWPPAGRSCSSTGRQPPKAINIGKKVSRKEETETADVMSKI